jgi:hypothetical protein
MLDSCACVGLQVQALHSCIKLSNFSRLFLGSSVCGLVQMLGGYGQQAADPAALQRLLNQAALQQQQQQQRMPGMVSQLGVMHHTVEDVGRRCQDLMGMLMHGQLHAGLGLHRSFCMHSMEVVE